MKTLRVVIASIIVVTAAGLYYHRGSARNEAISVGLKWLHQAQFAGMYIAQDKGFYEAQGISVDLIPRDLHGPTVVEQVAKGELDFGLMSPGEFLKAVDAGHQLKAVGAIFQYSPAAIVARSESNIFTPEDLEGKTIGVALNSEEAILPFKAMFERAGVNPDSVKYKAVGYRQASALINGEVDAVALYRTNTVFDLEKEGIKYAIINPERYGVSLYDDVIVVREEFFRDHPDIVKKFIKATSDGWEYADAHREEAVEIVMKEAFILRTSLPLMRRYADHKIAEMTPSQWDDSYGLFHRAGLIGRFEIYRFIAPNYFFDWN
jgi:ABC-type nitrate/sulfonate/bicarbonate transport system substrate-binding protein